MLCDMSKMCIANWILEYKCNISNLMSSEAPIVAVIQVKIYAVFIILLLSNATLHVAS